MSARRAADRNRIRGPQSALTDFLAANNISAQQIRESYEQRSRNAQQQNAGPPNPPPIINVDADEDADSLEQPVEPSRREPAKKRKRVPDKKTDSAKKSKKRKSKKKSDEGSDDDDDNDDDYDDSLGREIYSKSKPNPGQLENCEICEKRFTVTAYSKTGPDGGLVCSPCGRELTKDSTNADKKSKKPAARKQRRKTESNRLDGIVSAGPKSLQQLCIEKVADHHLDIEEFGDLPDTVLNRLSEIFSKRRVMNPRTVGLFLRPDLDEVAIHDAASELYPSFILCINTADTQFPQGLESDDYKQIFAIVPKLKKLVLGNASQFKDAVMEYMLERVSNLSHFQVYAANLITNDIWKTFFKRHGSKLQVLKLAWLDASFDDDVVETMAKHCTNLIRLKLKYCRKLTSESFLHIAKMKKLAHLSLHISHGAEPEHLIRLVTSLGRHLQTLSLENCVEADDQVIDAIRANCRQLSKFRLSNIDCATDAAFVSLFEPSSQVPPLTFLDLSSARDVDNSNPDGPEEVPIGLASESFKTLMSYHGSTLHRLQIPSCRHISHSAFWDVFVANQSSYASATKPKPKTKAIDVLAEVGTKSSDQISFPPTYPNLEEINVSFCNRVDTAIINGIFKSCPRLKRLIAFGCFKIDEIVVPGGVALIGVPRASDAIEQYGGAAEVESLFDAVDRMPGASAIEATA